MVVPVNIVTLMAVAIDEAIIDVVKVVVVVLLLLLLRL